MLSCFMPTVPPTRSPAWFMTARSRASWPWRSSRRTNRARTRPRSSLPAAGVLGMNLMFGALFGVGYVIVRYRQNGVLKRLQATPISAMQFLSAQLGSRLLIVVLINGIIFAGCNLFLDLIVLGSYFNLFIITALGSVSMIAVGLLVACRTANEELAGGLLNVATWPMLFLSEVWFSLDDSPQWLQALADFMPLTHIVKATRKVMLDGATLLEVSDHLLWLAVLAGICLVLAASLFRWTKNA